MQHLQSRLLIIFGVLTAQSYSQTNKTQNLETLNKTRNILNISGGTRRGIPDGIPGLTIKSDESQSESIEAKMFDGIKQTYKDCSAKNDIFKCLKIKALKVAQRVMKTKDLELITGVGVTQVKNLTRQSRALDRTEKLNEDQLQNLENESINGLLYDLAYNFLESHVININLPKLLEEARGRRKKNRYATPFLAALAIKGVIMSMTYKGIAVIAGTALIIGKMALVLAAILGLKKLVSGEKEKTTVEIVKHPTHSSSHTHSSSFEEGEGHYRRSIPSDDEMMILDNIYRDSYLN